MFDDDFKKKVSDAASDILIKKSREYFDNPTSFTWEIAGVAFLAGLLGGIAGSIGYEKSNMNRATSALGQLSYQIQQMTNEMNSLRSNVNNQGPINVTPNNNISNGTNFNSNINSGIIPPTFDEFGNKIN